MALQSFQSCTLSRHEGPQLLVKDYFADKCVIALESRIFQIVGDKRIPYDHSKRSKGSTYCLQMEDKLHEAFVIDRAETLEQLKAAHRPAPDDKKVTTRSVKVPKRISDGPKIFGLCNFKLQEETDDAKVKETKEVKKSGDLKDRVASKANACGPSASKKQKVCDPSTSKEERSTSTKDNLNKSTSGRRSDLQRPLAQKLQSSNGADSCNRSDDSGAPSQLKKANHTANEVDTCATPTKPPPTLKEPPNHANLGQDKLSIKVKEGGNAMHDEVHNSLESIPSVPVDAKHDEEKDASAAYITARKVIAGAVSNECEAVKEYAPQVQQVKAASSTPVKGGGPAFEAPLNQLPEGQSHIDQQARLCACR